MPQSGSQPQASPAPSIGGLFAEARRSISTDREANMQPSLRLNLMIPSPYNFEPALTDAEYAKLGVLALRWSHIEHILGNCLKVILRLTDDEAVIVVFSLSADQRAEKIHQLSKLSELPAPAKKAFEELRPILKGIQYVRNNVVHSIAGEYEGD